MCVGREGEGEGLIIIRNKVGTRDDKSDGGKTHPDRLSFFSFFILTRLDHLPKRLDPCVVCYICVGLVNPRRPFSFTRVDQG